MKTEKIPAGELAKIVGKCYSFATASGVLGVVCIVGGCSVKNKRNAAIAAAYSLSESSFKTYQEKTLEHIGEKKEQVIREAVAKEAINKVPIKESEIVVTGKGDVLCYDSLSGRYFKSCMEDIRKAENNFGDLLVWHIDNGYIDIDPSTQLTEDDRPCIVLNYRNMPKYYYDTSW